MNRPIFRSPQDQAIRIVQRYKALGTPRHGHKDDWMIRSVRTLEHRIESLTNVARWLRTQSFVFGLERISPDMAMQYLYERSEEVQQKQLNNDRRALEVIFQKKLPLVRSQIDEILSTRAYRVEQILEILKHQSAMHRFASEIAFAAGLRAHEFLTMLPRHERGPSLHRSWRPDLFHGREGERYTVVGKGGLIREVLLPNELAEVLESRRLAIPRNVVDRKVRYDQHYDIGGGQNWSQSFSSASKAALGWSNGAHGLRHNYAQARILELQQAGMTYDAAQHIVSQELGHFRPGITSLYYR